MCVVQDTVWACTGDGKIALFDVNTAELKTKTFAAHQGEILCVRPGPGDQYVVTGGVDFNTKSWQPNGTPLVASKYHHGAVECLLFTQLEGGDSSSTTHKRQDGGSGCAGSKGGAVVPLPEAAAAKLWTGSADGTVFCWADAKGDGMIADGDGKSIKLEGGKVRSLGLWGTCVWAGMDDGRINVLRVSDGSAVKTIKSAHSGPVLSLQPVGDQMWSGSGDKTIAAHGGSSFATLFSLGDQGGYLKTMFCRNWAVWTFNAADIKVYTGESIWRVEHERAEAALALLDATTKDLNGQIAKEKAAAHTLSIELADAQAAADRRVAEVEARVAELEAKLKELQGQYDGTQADLAAAQSGLQEAQSALGQSAGEAAQQLADAKLRSKDLEGVAAAAQAALDELRKAQQQLEADKDAADKAAAAEAAGLRAEVAGLRKAQEGLQGDLAQAQAGLEAERAAAAAAAAAWSGKESQLRSAMESDTLAKSSAAAALDGQLGELKGQMATLREENAALAAALASAKQEGDEARSAAGASGAELAGLRDKLAALQAELQGAT